MKMAKMSRHRYDKNWNCIVNCITKKNECILQKAWKSCLNEYS